MCDALISLLLFSCSVMSNSLWTHELQHAKLPCPSLSPGVCSNWCPLSQWCHPTVSSFVALFSSSCLQSFPASGNFSWVGSGFKEIIRSFSLGTIFGNFFFLLHLSKCNYVPGLGRTQCLGFPGVSDGKESAEDLGPAPGSGRSSGGGNGNPHGCSCLENSMDRGAWPAIAHRVERSQTWLSD